MTVPERAVVTHARREGLEARRRGGNSARKVRHLAAPSFFARSIARPAVRGLMHSAQLNVD